MPGMSEASASKKNPQFWRDNVMIMSLRHQTTLTYKKDHLRYVHSTSHLGKIINAWTKFVEILHVIPTGPLPSLQSRTCNRKKAEKYCVFLLLSAPSYYLPRFSISKIRCLCTYSPFFYFNLFTVELRYGPP